jgi:hypothetical protein
MTKSPRQVRARQHAGGMASVLSAETDAGAGVAQKRSMTESNGRAVNVRWAARSCRSTVRVLGGRK